MTQADLGKTDSNNKTALHYAFINNDINIILKLIKKMSPNDLFNDDNSAIKVYVNIKSTNKNKKIMEAIELKAKEFEIMHKLRRPSTEFIQRATRARSPYKDDLTC